MTPFRRPLPGETPSETLARQEDVIVFIIHRLQWPRDRAVALLDSLDERGLSQVNMDMRERRRPQRHDYNPFARAFEV